MKEMPRRLGLGQGVKGPEPYGCMNTGVAPAILKSRALDRLSRGGYRFAVGPELYIEDGIWAHIKGKVKTVWKLKGAPPWQVVKLYKTYKAAKREFERRCDVMRGMNDDDREQHRAAIRQARSADPEESLKGAAKLMDF